MKHKATDTASRHALGIFVAVTIVAAFDILHLPWHAIPSSGSVRWEAASLIAYVVARFPLDHPLISLLYIVTLCCFLAARKMASQLEGWKRHSVFAVVSVALGAMTAGYQLWYSASNPQLRATIDDELFATAVGIGTFIAAFVSLLEDDHRSVQIASGVVGGGALVAGIGALLLEHYYFPPQVPDVRAGLYTAAFLVLPFTIMAGRSIRRPTTSRVRKGLLVVVVLTIATGVLVEPSERAYPYLLEQTSLEASRVNPGLSRGSAEARCRHDDKSANLSTRDAVEIFHEHSNLPRLPANFDASQYNILFIVVETFRRDATSLHDSQLDTTPALRDLAQHSFDFADAHSPSSATEQSMRSIFGLTYPSHLPLDINYRPWHVRPRPGEDIVYVPAVLSAFGHRTFASVHALAGTWQPGFDEVFQPDSSLPDSAGDDAIVNVAQEFLAEADQKASTDMEATFGLVFFADPHHPYDSLPPDGSLWSDYTSVVRRTDQRIGKLLTYLSSLEISDETIVVVTGDHGEELQEHGQIGHSTNVRNVATHVPLLVSIPGINDKRHRITKPVSVSHLFAWLFLNFPQRSSPRVIAEERVREHLAPALLAAKTPAISEVLHHRFMRSALFFEDHAIHYDAFTRQYSLYERQSDHFERNNLIWSRPQQSQTKTELIDAYLGHRSCHAKYEVRVKYR